MTRLPILSRRQFLAAFGVATAGSALTGLDAFTAARERVGVSRHDVLIPGLPAALHRLSIAHLTDIHFFDGMDRGARRVMELMTGIAPDVTVLTGDYVESAAQLDQLGPFLEACRGRLATVLTIGNWEHQLNILPADIRRIADGAGAAFLFNQTHVVRREDASLAIVGLDDPRAGIPSPEQALPDVPSGVPTIWAFHAPGYADLLTAGRYPRPDFMLAGHTHGGQIRLPLFPVLTPAASGRFVEGWYRDTFAPLYVSRGVGTSTIRARFRCPPEIALFSLLPA
jgi:predicted MPP superfamily phosphohydrolase